MNNAAGDRYSLETNHKRLLWLTLLMFISGLSIPQLSPVCFLVFCFHIIRRSQDRILDTDSGILFAFLLSMLLIGGLNGEYTLDFRSFVLIVFLPVFGYLAGWKFFSANKGLTSHHALFLLFSYTVGLVTYCGLSLSLGFKEFNLAEIVIKRIIHNYWTDDPNAENYKMGVAMVGMFTNLSVGLLPLVIFRRNLDIQQRFWFPILAALGGLALVSLFIDVVLSNRTPFFLFMVNFLLAVVFLSKNGEFHRTFRTSLKFLAFVVVLTALIWTKVDLSDFFAGFLYRFEQGVQTSRYDYWIHALSVMFYYPFGGIQIENLFEVRSFHNLWFDVLRVSGWFPMILCIAFFVRQRGCLIRVLRDKRVPKIVRMYLLCTGMAILFAYIAEPVIQGPVVYFAVTFFFMGFVRSIAIAPMFVQANY